MNISPWRASGWIKGLRRATALSEPEDLLAMAREELEQAEEMHEAEILEWKIWSSLFTTAAVRGNRVTYHGVPSTPTIGRRGS